jgi:hypothetical protein
VPDPKGDVRVTRAIEAIRKGDDPEPVIRWLVAPFSPSIPVESCGDCGGAGRVSGRTSLLGDPYTPPCPSCGGRGWVPSREAVEAMAHAMWEHDNPGVPWSPLSDPWLKRRYTDLAHAAVGALVAAVEEDR